uniref:Uncharacterized protein n=1 Tax=Schistosoma japonicum TaxID=6182 RepID=Q5BZ37_SCHJA|nr:unknown [Schistosoma japonicum]
MKPALLYVRMVKCLVLILDFHQDHSFLLIIYLLVMDMPIILELLLSI